MGIRTLEPTDLYLVTDPDSFDFRSTADLPDLDAIIGQDRAVDAVEFAIGMRRKGYNVFALGPEGTGRFTLLSQAMQARATREEIPPDWCYVHNFADPQKPRALRLPSGRAAQLRDDMAHLTIELRSAIPAAFEDERFGHGREAIENELKATRERAFGELEAHAAAVGLGLIRTPVGFGLAPVRDGKIIEPEEFNGLPAAEQSMLRSALEKLEGELGAILHQVPGWEREFRTKARALVTETTRVAVAHLIEELRRSYTDLVDVGTYLDAVEVDVVENADDFLSAAAQAASVPALPYRSMAPETPALRRYQVNLIVDNGATHGAPVIREDHPTQVNLGGRVEYLAQMGALVTDYTMIKPGALHRANGGYLILDARRVLQQPNAWEALKRALHTGELRIESLGQSLGLTSTVSLEPEPIPLDIKVALYGDRELYYLLVEHDPDFQELFKVEADFDDQTDRTPEARDRFARLVATLARRESIRPLEAPAVARLLEHAARLAGEADKLSTNWGTMTDLLREADHYAGDGARAVLGRGDVDAAIEARLRRASRIRERMHEGITRRTVLVDTDGEAVGQVNGLSVVQLADVAFGWPTRITARVRLGGGEVVDIEREVELGGPIHSKGVLILAGFLGGRFAREQPLQLRASLVFEQSYGSVEGDSASLAELCALLSALGDLPIRQSLAMTGSVNQLGVVQAIGGVNEKIEGFFDICAARGLTGRQGVLIPAANVANLMLRRDVVEAVGDGQFTVFAVETVDDAIEALSGIPAGAPGPRGAYPPASVNGRVATRLSGLAEKAREFGSVRRSTPTRRRSSQPRA